MAQLQHVPCMCNFLTAGVAAQVLDVCAAKSRQWDRLGKLPSIHHPVKGYRFYRRNELDALLRQLMPTVLDMVMKKA